MIYRADILLGGISPVFSFHIALAFWELDTVKFDGLFGGVDQDFLATWQGPLDGWADGVVVKNSIHPAYGEELSLRRDG